MLIFSILKHIFLSRFIIASFVFLYFTETVFLVSFTLKLTPRCLNKKKKTKIDLSRLQACHLEVPFVTSP